MNTSLKHNIRLLFVSVLSVCAVAGCSEWTEPESVKFEYLTLEQKNPELYKAYMESLREYHNSDRNILIAKFDNKQSATLGMSDHINSFPDSVDMVILTNNEDLTETLLKDMRDLQVNKNIKVLAQIDYDGILADYKVYKEEMQDAEVSEAESTIMAFSEFIAEKMTKLMSVFGKYPYDGLNVIYNSLNPESCNEEDLVVLKKEQTAFFAPIIDWLANNPEKIFTLEGTPQNILVDGNLLVNADYILIQAQSAMVYSEFSHQVQKVIKGTEVPSDRIVVVVTTVSLDDPSIKNGHFSITDENGDAMSAIQGAAYWVNASYDSFIPRGVAVDHAQNDYFNKKSDYYELRQAISIMNPSPIK